jgi:hypothetical protein
MSATIDHSVARLRRRSSRPAGTCRGEHPQRHLATWSGILQADAYRGYDELYRPDRSPRQIRSALGWAHAWCKFFELTDIAASRRRPDNALLISPIALEAVKRIEVLFSIEREINGQPLEVRLAARQERSKQLVLDLEAWMRS